MKLFTEAKYDGFLVGKKKVMIMINKRISMQISLICLITVLLFVQGFLTSVNAQDSDTIWTATFGGTQWNRGNSVLETHDGYFVVAGFTESFGPDMRNVYIIRNI